MLISEVNPKFKKELEGLPQLAEIWVAPKLAEIVAKLQAFHAGIQLNEISSLLLRISEAFISDPPKANPTAHSPDVWLALEALLWRGYEALKATTALLDVGVLENLVTLGIAQEALIRFRYLDIKPERLIDFKANDAFGEWQTLDEFRTWGLESGIPLPAQHTDLLTNATAELKLLGFDPTLQDDRKRLIDIRRKLGWKGMIILEDAEAEVFGSRSSLRYQEVFTPRDRVAHSLSQIWGRYVELDGDTVKTGSSIRSSTTTQPIALFVWADLFDRMKTLRPQLITDYGRWCEVLYGGSFHSALPKG